MSNQLYNESGTLPPATIPVPGGATVFQLQNASAGTLPRGATVRLTAGGRDSADDITEADLPFLEYAGFLIPFDPQGTELSNAANHRDFGCLLQEVAAGDFGLVLVRGFCLALMEGSTFPLEHEHPLCITGNTTQLYHLDTVRNLDPEDKVKVVARALCNQPVGPTPVLRPCLFNGIEGLGGYSAVVDT